MTTKQSREIKPKTILAGIAIVSVVATLQTIGTAAAQNPNTSMWGSATLKNQPEISGAKIQPPTDSNNSTTTDTTTDTTTGRKTYGSSLQNEAYNKTMGGDTPLPINANQQQTTNHRTGIAPPLTDIQLNHELDSVTGPPLPDATLNGHRQDALIQMGLKYRSMLLDLQSTVNTKLLTVMHQDEQIRKQMALNQKPLDLKEKKQNATTSPQSYITNTSETDTSQTTTTKTRAKLKITVDTTPVVYAIGGIGNQLTAKILIPYSGYTTVNVGDTLPNGMTITGISQNGVIVTTKKDRREILPMGSSVPGKITKHTRGLPPNPYASNGASYISPVHNPAPAIIPSPQVINPPTTPFINPYQLPPKTIHGE